MPHSAAKESRNRARALWRRGPGHNSRSHQPDGRRALKAAGKTAEFKIYPGAPHGFHADYRPSYRKEAAKDGWKQMTDWFKKYNVLS